MIRWLRAHVKQYRVHIDKIAVAGGSAGGHLALPAGLTGRDEESSRQLINLVGNLRNNQIVDPRKEARMKVPS